MLFFNYLLICYYCFENSNSTFEGVPSGCIYANAFHRNFAQLDRKQTCKITPYDPNQDNVNCSIGSMTIEVFFI